MQIAVIRLLLSPFPWDMAGAALAACSSTLHAHVLPRSILTVEKSRISTEYGLSVYCYFFIVLSQEWGRR